MMGKVLVSVPRAGVSGDVYFQPRDSRDPGADSFDLRFQITYLRFAALRFGGRPGIPAVEAGSVWIWCCYGLWASLGLSVTDEVFD